MQMAEAVQKPFKNVKILIIGIVISIIPLINVLLLPGYLLRVARNTMQGNPIMPEWKEFGNMGADSIRMFAISLAYTLPGVVVLALSLGTAVAAYFSAIGSGTAEGAMAAAVLTAIWAGAPGLVVGALFVVIGGIGSSSAVMMFAKTTSFSSAFKIREVYTNFFKREFLKTFVMVILLSIVVGFIEAIVPILGWLISLLVIFPMAVAFQSLLADAYGK